MSVRPPGSNWMCREVYTLPDGVQTLKAERKDIHARLCICSNRVNYATSPDLARIQSQTGGHLICPFILTIGTEMLDMFYRMFAAAGVHWCTERTNM